MTTLTDALTFITGEASADDLDRILNAVNVRRKHLATLRAATVSVGIDVTLRGLSPKALNGLTGTVENIDGNRGDVRMDRASTEVLAWGNTRFASSARNLLHGDKGILVRGVPLGCCEPS